MSTALYLLRCYQIGIPLQDLDELEVGFVFDLLTESLNDEYEYKYKATQEDFNRF